MENADRNDSGAEGTLISGAGNWARPRSNLKFTDGEDYTRLSDVGESLKARLASLPDVFDIEDTFGRRQAILRKSS